MNRTAPLPKDYPTLRERVRPELRPMLDEARQASLEARELRERVREREQRRQRLLYALRANGVSLGVLGIACEVAQPRIAQLTDKYRPGRGNNR